MHQDWKELNDQLVLELDRYKLSLLPECHIAESSFRAAVRYWHLVKEKFLASIIGTDLKEIEFFKKVKPHFTAYIEYYMMMNQGLLFVPDKLAERAIYWAGEEKRYQRFNERHQSFINYYASGCVDHDVNYFLKRNNRLVVSPQERIYEDEDCWSSHDRLVRGILANRMYTTYVCGKLNELKKLK